MQSKPTRPLRVMKFGGTSVGDAERIERVARTIAEHARGAAVVVVVSAMGGVTEMLIRAAHAAARGEEGEWRDIGREFSERHRDVAERLLPDQDRAALLRWLSEQVKTFENLCSGFSLVREVTPRSMDSLSSLGEVLAATLLAAVLRSQGRPAEAVDATEIIVTDEQFGNASPRFEETDPKILARLRPLIEQGTLPVVTGFRGATPSGLCTTLGRGASDYTATILGAALDADEISIWTDVDGVMTADPHLVPGAKVIPEISYRETIELSFFGAKVLHPKAIQPAMKKGIPVWIKNTFHPSGPGTKIAASAVGQAGVRAITSVSKASLFTLGGNDSLSFPRLAAKVFSSLSIDDIPSLMVTQSSAENVLCFAVHDADAPRVRTRLEQAFELEMRHEYVESLETMAQVGIVAATGEQMKGTPGIAGRLFGALGRRGINVIAIAQGSSELSISFAVKSEDIPEAVRAIHEEFQL
ncbi:MAG TPA: aspartate kinase [Candidatus Acidoferrales bacterium]|nr:aspartate kinase [Candidatus Acidoferrales bacterium]